MSTLPPEGEGTNVPQQPEQPMPPQAPAAPQYDAPQPEYGAPQQPGYGAPQPGYAQPGYPQAAPAADPLSNITLNYWLSVFFIWVPALIFYIIEKDKGNPHVRALHAANLNFSLLRTGLFVVGWMLAFIPILGPLLMGAAHLVLFVFHIMAAAKVAETYKSGGADPFLFNIPLVK